MCVGVFFVYVIMLMNISIIDSGNFSMSGLGLNFHHHFTEFSFMPSQLSDFAKTDLYFHHLFKTSE